MDANLAAQDTQALHEGTYVDCVVLNGAAAATIQTDDVIVSIDNTPMGNAKPFGETLPEPGPAYAPFVISSIASKQLSQG